MLICYLRGEKLGIFDIDRGDMKYLAVRNLDRLSDIRIHIEKLWPGYKEYADPDFERKFRTAFHNRYWEMYLGTTFLNLGMVLKPNSGQGPDHILVLPDGGKVLVEATAVSAGTTVDMVPPLLPADFEDDSEAQPIPIPQITLRIRSAIREKYENKWNDYVRKGIVAKETPYVIAINVGEIVQATTNDFPPLCAYACLGFGQTEIILNENGKGKLSVCPNRNIQKKNYTQIDTNVFENLDFSYLSGVLLSDANPFFGLRERGGFEFLHNPNAENPLPMHWFLKGKEYWVTGSESGSENILHMRKHKRGT